MDDAHLILKKLLNFGNNLGFLSDKKQRNQHNGDDKTLFVNNFLNQSSCVNCRLYELEKIEILVELICNTQIECNKRNSQQVLP